MLPDDEFLRAFFGLTLANQDFHHRDHLRLAWLVVRRHGGDVAEEIVANGIRRFARHHGSALYHDTMTRFWVRLVVHATEAKPEIAEFEAFLLAFPFLLDKELFLRHWSRPAMFAPAARAAWRDPDLVPLPF